MLKKIIVGWGIWCGIVFSFSAAIPKARADLPKVLPGIYQLFSSPYLELLSGQRIGVLAHQASQNAEGVHLVDLLASQPYLQLKVIFAPEHGFRGQEDVGVPDTTDPVTGLPVYSLYGPRRAPTAEQLALVDVVIIDLQDVGVRYYTYAATMALTMRACKQAGKKVIILDRPNPIGGEIVEGAILESGFQGGIASFYSMSTRHGMTLGEIARLFNSALGINADLTIVPLMGWHRSMLWDETGLPWYKPSPALVSFDQTFLYGIFGPLESLNIAVGRGITNEEAFKVYGAPWITSAQARKLTSAMNLLMLPGLRFSTTEWIAKRREYEGKLCRGFRIEVTNRAQVDGFRSLIEVMKAMRKILGKKLNLSNADTDLGATWLRKGIEAQAPTSKLIERSKRESTKFLKEREEALIY